ncbi:MAG: hypothetical protein SGARI_002527 [Bacillariaceae sp.]
MKTEDETATHGTAEEEATVDSKMSGEAAAADAAAAPKPTVVKAKKTPTKRRKKNKKPSNYPKRPLSAYNVSLCVTYCFFKDTRETIIQEVGKTNFQEMVRLIAARWKEATKEDKKQYEEEALQDLERYKKEVQVFEKEAAEKKRIEEEKQAEADKKRRETERKFLEAQRQRSAESASGVRLGADDPRFGFNKGGFTSEEAMLAAAMGGAMPAEMAARMRLEQELRGVDDARAQRLRQLEMAAQLQGAGAAGLRGPGGASMFGGNELEMEIQRRMMAGAGGDPLAMANELELRQRLAMLRNPNEQGMEEQEKLLRESAYGATLGAAGLGGRFGGFGGMGMGNPYEEILLREQMLRREREALLLGGGGAASLYGGLGAGGLGALGLGGGAASGLFGGGGGANPAVANADMHTNAAAAGLASLRAQSGYVPGAHLERLSDEELRALSSKGASAFKRFGGEEKAKS